MCPQAGHGDRLQPGHHGLEVHVPQPPEVLAVDQRVAHRDEQLARQLLESNPVNRSYRWLANEALVHPHLHRPHWRALSDELHASWLRDLEEMGPRLLPAPAPPLPEPAALIRRVAPAPVRSAPSHPSWPGPR